MEQLTESYRLAFVVAGTDVLSVDPLGRLGLSVAECASRDLRIADKLNSLNIPFVFLGGGGYANESTQSIVQGIQAITGRDDLKT